MLKSCIEDKIGNEICENAMLTIKRRWHFLLLPLDQGNLQLRFFSVKNEARNVPFTREAVWYDLLFPIFKFRWHCTAPSQALLASYIVQGMFSLALLLFFSLASQHICNCSCLNKMENDVLSAILQQGRISSNGIGKSRVE